MEPWTTDYRAQRRVAGWATRQNWSGAAAGGGAHLVLTPCYTGRGGLPAVHSTRKDDYNFCYYVVKRVQSCANKDSTQQTCYWSSAQCAEPFAVVFVCLLLHSDSQETTGGNDHNFRPLILYFSAKQQTIKRIQINFCRTTYKRFEEILYNIKFKGIWTKSLHWLYNQKRVNLMGNHGSGKVAPLEHWTSFQQ